MYCKKKGNANNFNNLFYMIQALLLIFRFNKSPLTRSFKFKNKFTFCFHIYYVFPSQRNVCLEAINSPFTLCGWTYLVDGAERENHRKNGMKPGWPTSPSVVLQIMLFEQILNHSDPLTGHLVSIYIYLPPFHLPSRVYAVLFHFCLFEHISNSHFLPNTKKILKVKGGNAIRNSFYGVKNFPDLFSDLFLKWIS